MVEPDPWLTNWLAGGGSSGESTGGGGGAPPGWHIDANGNLVQDTTGTTYTQFTDEDGSVTGTPGSIYQKSSSGAITVIYRPSSSGGGGVSVSLNPGSTGAWSRITDPVSGDVYDYNELTKEKVLIFSGAGAKTSSKESYPGSGVTAEGVSIYAISSSKSPTGYILADGTIILPNGADAGLGNVYEGSAGGKPETITIGGVPYIWDGKKFVVAPGFAGSGTSSGSTSLGGGYAGGGGSSGGGSGSGSTSTREGGYTNVTTERREGGFSNTSNSTSFNTSEMGPQSLANAAAERAFRAGESAADRAQRASEFAATQGVAAKEAQRQAIKDFQGAISSTDPSALAALIYANGSDWQNTINNATAGGATAVSPNLLRAAAGFLDLARGGTGGTTGAGGLQDTGGGSLEGTAGGGVVPSIPGTGPVSGEVAAGGVSAPLAPAPSPFATITVGGTGQGGQQTTGREIRVAAGADGQPLTDANGNYYLYDPNDKLGQGIARTDGARWNMGPGGGVKGWYEEGQSSPLLINAAGGAVDINGNPVLDAAQQRTMDNYINNSFSRGGLARGGSYSFSGLGSQSIDPSRAGYKTAEQQAAAASGGLSTGGAIDYGADNILRPVNATSNRPVDPTAIGAPGTHIPGTGDEGFAGSGYLDPASGLWKPLPKLAHGGLARGAFITGDSPSGRTTGNEEMVIAPQGAQVIPMRRMNPQMRRGLMRGMRRYATGTSIGFGTGADWDYEKGTGADQTGGAIPAPVGIQPAGTTTGEVYQSPSGPGSLGGGVEPTLLGGDQPIVSSPSAPTVWPSAPAPVAGTPSPVGTVPITGAGGLPVAGAPGAPTGGTTPVAGGGVSIGGGTGAPGSPLPWAYSGTGGGGLDEGIQGLLGGGTGGGALSPLEEELAKFKATGFDYPQLNPYDVSFEQIDPVIRELYFRGEQARKGIPIASQLHEQNRFRLRGLNRGQVAVGY